MSGLNFKLQQKKRRLVKNGLSLFKSRKVGSGGRRAKHISWRMSKLRIKISLRYFRTNKASRSKLQKQVVFRVYFLPYKEVVLVWSRTRRRNTNRLSTRTNLQLVYRSTILLIMLLSMVSSVYFIIQLGEGSKKIVLAAPKPTASKLKEPAPQKIETLARSEPTRINIEKISLSAALVNVGYWPNGSLQIPIETGIAGWYKYSPTPGELGPSIIAGHLDTTSGPSVFWRLNELQAGDTVTINRADGSVAKFRVDDIKQYIQTELPTSDIYGNINYAGIRLITCGGVFDKITKHYSHNIVVYGSLII